MSDIEIGGVLTPAEGHLRLRRPIAGLPGYEITQTGLIWSAEEQYLYGDNEYPDWPYMEVADHHLIHRVHLNSAAATAWLTREQRDAIRAACPDGCAHNDPAVLQAISDYQVASHVVVHVARYQEGAVPPVVQLPHIALLVQEGSVSAYGVASLGGPGRTMGPRSKRRALHAHRFDIEGQRYYFYAHGAKRWFFGGDRVSFRYYVKPDGRHLAIKSTIRIISGKGKAAAAGHPLGRSDAALA